MQIQKRFVVHIYRFLTKIQYHASAKGHYSFFPFLRISIPLGMNGW